jgi:nicotinamide riboside kinase
MTNEDIIHTLEEFVKWGDDDKSKVIKSLSMRAVLNLEKVLDRRRMKFINIDDPLWQTPTRLR